VTGRSPQRQKSGAMAPRVAVPRHQLWQESGLETPQQVSCCYMVSQATTGTRGMIQRLGRAIRVIGSTEVGVRGEDLLDPIRSTPSV
jgi:hypothetical protein